MFTAALDGLVDRFGLQRRAPRRGDRRRGAQAQPRLQPDARVGARLARCRPTPRPTICSRPAAPACRRRSPAADGIAAGRYEVAVAGGVDTTSDAPIGLATTCAAPCSDCAGRSPTSTGSSWSASCRPASGWRSRTNAEPRTGLSMGEHAAITAKKMGITRADQDELAAASHRNMAAAYDRGFFDDLVTPFLGVTATTTCAPDSSVREAGQAQAGVRRKARRRHDDRRQLHAADRRRLGGAAGQRRVGRRALLPPLAYFVDAETAAVDYVNGADGLLMAPTYAVPRLLARNGLSLAGLRLLRDPRGVRLGGAGAPAGVGVRGVLQGAAGPGRRAGRDRPDQAQRQRLLAGGRSPVRRDRRADRRAAGQAAAEKKAAGRCAA